MNDRNKLIAAVVFALVGIGLAAYLYYRSSGGGLRESPAPLPTGMKESLERTAVSLSMDTEPSADTLSSVLVSAKEKSLSALLSTKIDIERPDDLVIAFQDQLRATLDGNFDQHVAGLNARGYKLDPTSASERKSWEAAAELSRWSKLGLDQLKVEPVYVNGKRVKPEKDMNYYSQGEYTRTADVRPLGNDVESQRLTIIEVSLPMELARVGTSDRVAGTTAYRFAWNREAKQWVPWSIVVLKTDRHPTLYPPF
ncbi:MAG: hypothetical protein IT434_08340 [Phycisphaerales bacterium]|jgi:hypothetical protein|nr:hypothetical protein [Phycisphaerales bacterium]